jgi:hypothetical protein
MRFARGSVLRVPNGSRPANLQRRRSRRRPDAFAVPHHLHVYAMCGVAFSGKSTLALRIAAELSICLISLDAWSMTRSPAVSCATDAKLWRWNLVQSLRLSSWIQRLKKSGHGATPTINARHVTTCETTSSRTQNLPIPHGRGACCACRGRVRFAVLAHQRSCSARLLDRLWHYSDHFCIAASQSVVEGLTDTLSKWIPHALKVVDVLRGLGGGSSIPGRRGNLRYDVLLRRSLPCWTRQAS